MKIRSGFVSNSSSSSYVCDVCGNIESGWDLSLTDAGMVECVRGHIFCEEHWIVTDEFKSIDDFEVVFEKEYPDEYARGCVEVKNCPICTLNHITTSDVMMFLLRRRESTFDEIVKQIRDEFEDYKSLHSYLKSKW